MNRDSLTEQELFWAGDFGDQYIDRNDGDARIASNLVLFSDIFRSTGPIHSLIEFGANIGLNLLAIRQLLPRCALSGVEINAKAAQRLRTIPNVQVYEQSLYEFKIDQPRDFVLTKGVLIHLQPETLPNVYELLYSTTKRYLCIIEYYNPTPVEIPYREHHGKLFKRDFAGEIMSRFKDIVLRNYGFIYKRDPLFPQDGLTWFLLEKRNLL